MNVIELLPLDVCFSKVSVEPLAHTNEIDVPKRMVRSSPSRVFNYLWKTILVDEAVLAHSAVTTLKSCVLASRVGIVCLKVPI